MLVSTFRCAQWPIVSRSSNTGFVSPDKAISEVVVRRGTPKPQDVCTWHTCSIKIFRDRSQSPGTRYLENIQQNHRSGALNPLLPHPLQQPFKPHVVPLDNLARAEKPQDPRARGERTEHDGDPAVFVDMADAFAAGTGGVDVGGVVGVEDGEGG